MPINNTMQNGLNDSASILSGGGIVTWGMGFIGTGKWKFGSEQSKSVDKKPFPAGDVNAAANELPAALEKQHHK